MEDHVEVGVDWLTPSHLFGWMWRAVFKPQGLLWFVLLSIAVSYVWNGEYGPWWGFLFFTPGTMALIVMTVVPAMALQVLGDIVAYKVVQKVFAEPNPRNLLHQAVFLSVASAGLVVAFALFGTGTIGIDGHW